MMIEDYKTRSREFTKFIKTATVEEIEQRLLADADDRMLTAFIIKRLRTPRDNASPTGTNLFDLLGGD